MVQAWGIEEMVLDTNTWAESQLAHSNFVCDKKRRLSHELQIMVENCSCVGARRAW